MGSFSTVGVLDQAPWLAKKPRFDLLRLLALLLLLLLMVVIELEPVQGMGVNWGTQASHPLPASVVVQLLKDNNITKVKLFDSDSKTLSALAGTNIEVMVAIPNNLLQDMTDASTATSWVQNNVANYIFEGGVNIKYVAVANEPFLTAYNGTYVNLTLPALQNIQNALNNANLGAQIKATVPMNSDVLSDSALPSNGSFRSDSAQEMLQIVQFLNQSSSPFTINIYPFLSLSNNPGFPLNYVFFNDTKVQVQDGTKNYTNTFDASYDTLVAALTSAGYPDMPIIVGEIGWPTDGFTVATPSNAQEFNQGFINHVQGNAGTPSRPNTAIEYYFFGLIDEDDKSVAPGDFERHWGIFTYDGNVKYPLTLPGTAPNAGNVNGSLVTAKGVQYLQRQWCVVADSVVNVSSLLDSLNYACSNSDCTELGYGSSCNNILDAKGNASYAFNQYFQIQNQDTTTCVFSGLATVTDTDPSVGNCKFIVQLAINAAGTSVGTAAAAVLVSVSISLFLLLAAPLL